MRKTVGKSRTGRRLSHNDPGATPTSRRAAVPAAAPSVGALIEQGPCAFERAGLAYGHGRSDAADDAAALVFHALGLDHAAAPEAYAIVPDATQRERVRALFAERIAKR